MPSWHLPTTGRIGAAELLLAHIPGAVFLTTTPWISQVPRSQAAVLKKA
jgi:hypothetical protein